MWLTITLVVLFSLGFMGSVLSIKWLISLATMLFSILLFVFGTGYLYAAIANNIRLRILCKRLNISRQEYEKLTYKMELLNIK